MTTCLSLRLACLISDGNDIGAQLMGVRVFV
jgi:hypothetical protein